MTNNKKSVLITGVSGGIGNATAIHFSEMGWKVFGTDILPKLKTFPKNGTFIKADIAQENEIVNLIESVKKENDSLSALINNAALQVAKPFLDTTIIEWEKIQNINLKSAILLTQLSHPLLKINGGAIVNISSVHAVATSKDIASYAATKGALLSLTRALAIEFAQDDIRVNTVLPGAVDTPMLDAGLSRGHLNQSSIEKSKDALAAKTVIGRIGKPEEIAKAIYFLADEAQSSFITGQPLIVDGGATIRLSTE
jgi:glucose 1-dehydrogenase